MKKIILLSATILFSAYSTSTYAKPVSETELSEPVVKCFARFVEAGAKEVIKFNFNCDNYGKDATFTSKSGRFYVSGFSEESCSPVLIVHDQKTNSATYAAGLDESGKRNTSGFDIFKDKIVTARLEADVKREEVLMGNSKNYAELACSTDEAQLNELLEE